MPPFEVIDLVQPLGLEEGGGLFAADAAGAEHRDLRLRAFEPASRLARTQAGKSRKLSVCGSIAPAKVPIATS